MSTFLGKSIKFLLSSFKLPFYEFEKYFLSQCSLITTLRVYLKNISLPSVPKLRLNELIPKLIFISVTELRVYEFICKLIFISVTEFRLYEFIGKKYFFQL